MKSKLPLFLAVLFLVFIFWNWWLTGPRVASDSSMASQTYLKSLMDMPQTWSTKETEGLGEYTVFTLWSWPFNFVYGTFANLNFPFEVLQRFLVILPFLIVGGIGIWKLGRKFNLSDFAKVISVIFYLTNTYILLVIDGGQLSISLAYAIFPNAFLALENSIGGSFKRKIILGLIISAIGIFDIRFIYLFILLALFKFLYELIFTESYAKWISEWVKLAIISGIVVLGLNFFWLYVLYKAPLQLGFYSYLTKVSFPSFISLDHALLLFSPHWFKNVFGDLSSPDFKFLIFPALVFLAAILKPKNKIVGFWLVVALISVFFAKGGSEPFPHLYYSLYSRVPGFSLFRDSSKFFFVTALAYSLLIGIAVDETLKRIKKKKIRVGLITILLIYIGFLLKPVWSGQMTGTFSQPTLQGEYQQLNELISKDKTSANIFWIPTVMPLTKLDPLHPILEAARLAQKRPFAQATIGEYEIFNFLREAPYMGELFNVANIGNVVYPPLDPRRDSMEPDHINYYNTFLNQLSNLPWLSKVQDSKIPLLKIKNHQNRLFIISNSWWVIGSDDVYSESTGSAKLSLSNNAFIFVQESPELGKRLNELSNVKILLNKKTNLDLAASFIESKDLIFPSRLLNHDPNNSGWWKRDSSEFPDWKNFLEKKYGISNQDFDLGGGWAVAEGNLKLEVKNDNFKKGHILLARVLESSRSGEIKFYQQGTLIGKIDTVQKQPNIEWFEVGNLVNNENLTISTSGDLNVVNALASLEQGSWQEDKKIAEVNKNKISDFKQTAVNENKTNINYQQISPTEYKISIRNLEKEATLIFSQNFDSRWKLNGQTPFPIYSFLNGFKVDKNGDYVLSFEPQKYVPGGLLVSILTLLISVGILLV